MIKYEYTNTIFHIFSGLISIYYSVFIYFLHFYIKFVIILINIF